MKLIIFFFTVSINVICSFRNFPNTILENLFQHKSGPNPTDLYLREWINKLAIDLPNDLIKNETRGYIENLTIYNISLESFITTRKKQINNKVGVNITLRNASFNIKGKYIFVSENPKNFSALISSLIVKLPFYLIKGESGLISEVDTSGFTIDLSNAQIKLDLDMNDIIKNIVGEILLAVLKLIKNEVIEKNAIKILNEKLTEMLEFINDIISNEVYPKELNILTDKSDLANVKNSPILGSVAYLLSNLTGANGPLSLNTLVNLFTQDTGTVNLKTFYDKEITFEFGLTDKSNKTLANFEFTLDDLNISGLNTWREVNALQPYDILQLVNNMILDNLNIDASFALRVKLYNNSQLVKEETTLYEKALLRANLQNNKLNGLLQFPFNNKRSKEYTNQECLNIDCVIDLVDSNGTGINALSLKGIFNYILLEIKEGDDLEEDLDDAFDKLTDLFITSFNDQIGLLINVLLNSTLINFANNKLNEFLYSKNCPGVQDPEYKEIKYTMTYIIVFLAVVIFILFIFFPYILGKACKKDRKDTKINLLQEENIAESKGVQNVPIEAHYCFDNINIQWIKEFGRTDPYGASLFLNPKVPLFFRIFIPLGILLNIAIFASANICVGSSVFIGFNVGREIKAPSLYDLGLVNSVHDMWVAGCYILSVLIAFFTGIWPYIKLILMLISFFLPTSILSHKGREKFLLFLDATGKFSILDSYVIMMMLVSFYLSVEIPVTEQSEAEQGFIIDLYIYIAYGIVTIIIGTLVSLCLSHIVTHLHRNLDEHPDQNKGEKAENYRSIMSFAKVNYIKDFHFRVFISSLLFLTLILVILGSIVKSFSFDLKGLAGYAINLLNYPTHKDISAIDLGIDLRKSYKNPNASEAIFTQVIFFLTTIAIPLAFLLNLIILWFIPMTRKAQKFFYSIAEILNAWSCVDVLAMAIISCVEQVTKFAIFMVGDKCDNINPIIKRYFSKILDGYDSCFEVKTSLKKGFWIYFCAAISFFICSFVILKVCRYALNERLPDHVKEYLRNKNNNDEDRISKISNINDFHSSVSRETLVSETLSVKKILEEK